MHDDLSCIRLSGGPNKKLFYLVRPDLVLSALSAVVFVFFCFFFFFSCFFLLLLFRYFSGVV